MNFIRKINKAELVYNDNKTPSKIQNLLDEIKDRGFFALVHLSEENQVMITHWAQDMFDRYKSVLENQPSKIKNKS